MRVVTRPLTARGVQVSLGPEEAAIAQSQHFDQLEALWNKISPPRRRSNKTYVKQTILKIRERQFQSALSARSS
ncbi:hypothetical protein EVAR_30086_1 [Eumeta japonica]|uniref:Uncharacterized protein n=1 Tax=Eumeta variegata TaxID=151549 RepID=A0A4C1XBX1_EUMVA|nr:hypothetical protein EVAR_30086_1 [Eumeta japonica]